MIIIANMMVPAGNIEQMEEVANVIKSRRKNVKFI